MNASTPPLTQPTTADRRTQLRICALLAALTTVVYFRVIFWDFVAFDDPRYVQEHPRIWSGLTFENIRWALTTDYFSNWHPLTWLSYMLDCQLFGPRPGWMHFVNLLLHIANSVLLFLVLQRMTRDDRPSAFVALMFALHPLHVESVAWISERKDVLSTLFWILCMGAYTGYVRKPGLRRYALVATLLFLGLASKAMLVTLPCVLLLLDYWPLDRFATLAASGRSVLRIALGLFVEKIPLFGISALSAVLTARAQYESGAVESLETMSFGIRAGNAAVSYAGYLWNTFWPTHLSAYYPHAGLTPPDWTPAPNFYSLVCCSAAALFAVSLLVLWRGRQQKYLLVGWLWYLGTLVPVIGLVQVGTQGMADRYTYVPLIGIFIMVAWGVPELLRRVPGRQLWLDLSSVGAVAACLILTWIHVGYWRNGVTLYSHAIAVTENNFRAQGLLAVALAREGRHAEAVEWCYSALKINPANAQLRNHLGASLTSLGRFAEANKCFRESIAIDPEVVSTHFNYGIALAAQGALDEAIVEYQTTLRLEPSAKAHNNLGGVFAKQGRLTEAAEQYHAALRLNPHHKGARHNLDEMLVQRPPQDRPAIPAAASP
ncbi:MAG: tetratricopeptide repeat protein [Planctomycetia bacterium]|nr:tetratricopeptide repeat protein [Planctomycetia bacterium]